MAKGKSSGLITRWARRLLGIADVMAPHVDALTQLGLRVWIAIVFWQSGMTKIVSWDSTVLLFEHEYAVPFLPAEFAAQLTTFSELLFPVLLFLGLGARLATIPLLIMTAVIQLTYLESADHLLWALFLGAIALRGPGMYSWDFFIRKTFMKDTQKIGEGNVVIAIIALVIITVITGHEVASAMGNGKDAWLDSWQAFWYPEK